MKLFVDCLKTIGCCYFLAAGTLYTFQRKLQYLPAAQHPAHPRQLSRYFESIEEVIVCTADGHTLHGWHWPAVEGGRHATVSILQLHGNAGNRMHRLRWAFMLRKQFGCAITLLDYRGYGGSSGQPSESGLILDALAGLRWLCARQARADMKLVLHLESIGSAAGINAFSRLSVEEQSLFSGIVVEGGLSSCIELAQEKLSVFPLSVLMVDKWNATCSAAGKIHPQIHFLSLHGTRDVIVPMKYGQKLFEAVACEEKRFIQFTAGGHNDLLDQPSYVDSLNSFYAELN